MTPERWKAVKALFLDAASLAPSDREAFLIEVCQTDTTDKEVVAIVQDLLTESDDSSPDLAHPCWQLGPKQVCQHVFEPGWCLLDRFEIVGFLGDGGVGEVYRAFDRQQAVFVALKTLRNELVDDEHALAMLRKELNTARFITHHNVCRLYDFHIPPVSGAPAFFTMELLEGETLAQYLRRRGSLQVSEALPIVIQILDGLEAVHTCGIVHRDLKSANIFLTQKAARVVVMDFGLAREASRSASSEVTLLTNALAGTPPYMAPEQLRGEIATFASDIHALGVVLFEIVTGRRPFEGSTSVEIASRRLAEEAPSPRRYAATLERRWEYTIVQCLAKERLRRPQSVAEVREFLTGARPVIRFSRRRLAAACAAPVAVALGAIGILTTVRKPVAVVIYDVKNLTSRPDLEYLCKGTTAELLRRLSPLHDIAAIPAYATEKHAAVARAAVMIDGWLKNGQDGLQITVRLVEDRNGHVVWSQTYSNRSFDNLIELQKRIAAAAGSALQKYVAARGRWAQVAGMWAGPRVAESDQTTRNTTAFDYYLRGNSLLQEGTLDSIRASIDYLERAVSEDSHFALAWASLGEAYLGLHGFSVVSDPSVSAPARNCAERAIREAPELAEGYALLGAVQQLEWDWVSSESSYNRALTLKPRFSRARRWRGGLILQFARFEEAIMEMHTAFEQDPYDRAGISGYGLTLLFADRCGDAVTFLEENIGERDLPVPRFNLCQAYARLGYRSTGSDAEGFYRKALAQAEMVAGVERRSRQTESGLSDRMFALVHSLRGEIDQAEPFIQRIREAVLQNRTSPVYLAMMLSSQKRLDEALSAVEQATMMRDPSVLYLRVNIFLENLRGLPRFETVLQTIHLK